MAIGATLGDSTFVNVARGSLDKRFGTFVGGVRWRVTGLLGPESANRCAITQRDVAGARGAGGYHEDERVGDRQGQAAST